jgi:hypothetical protein
MRTLVWAAVCLPDLLVGSGANATPEACPQDQMRRADGQYISNTGKGQSGNPDGGTAVLEAAQSGFAAELS